MLHAPGQVGAYADGSALDGAAGPGGAPRVLTLVDQSRAVQPATVASLVCDAASAVVTVAGLPDPADRPAEVLRVIGGTGTTVEMVTAVPAADGLVDLVFVVSSPRCATVTGVLATAQPAIGFRQVRCEHRLFRLTLAGPGVGADPSDGRWREVVRRAGAFVLTCAVAPERVEAMCRVARPGALVPRLRAALDPTAPLHASHAARAGRAR
ncbi:hypothetical protein [Micromonospora sp. NPDC047074]|uniref:hypothetical protein n=1 Tax=Micromonospora sp. NPDC047074 TaxID=3154339 RepID=UPI0033F1EB1A